MVARWQLVTAAAALACLLRARPGKKISGEGKRVVVITGCDSGFGKSLLAKAVEAGFVVVAGHFSQAAADAAVKEFGDRIIAVACDLTKSVQPLVDATKQTIAAAPDRKLWALVNNAGMLKMGFTDLLPPAAFEKVMKVNFHATVELTYELLPLLKACPGSRMVATSSSAGFLALPCSGPYSASKFALEAYCDCLRVELMPFRVNVVLVEPGGHKTSIGAGFFDSCLQTFREAPKERQAYYGEEWMQSTVNMMNANSSIGLGDPANVVRTMLHTLQVERPSARYAVGVDARLVFPLLGQLPDSWRDRLLKVFAYPKALKPSA